MVKQFEANGEQVILGRRCGDLALVASKSQPGYWHNVKGGECDCQGFAYRKACRHIKAVEAAREQRRAAGERALAILNGVA